MADVEALNVTVRTIPTDEPESDGTLAWDSATIVIVEDVSKPGLGLELKAG